ncbi:MAG: mannose-6-phosphate isomerase, class I [Chitinophagaceae bacterium]|nr:mannose-6-phosphate isomerase, class I [Chitinophagaceae bacterium]
METTKGIFKLTGKVQHYAWGGAAYIPQLLGVNNGDQKPFAEYWMGAHPSAPSTISVEGNQVSLFDYVQQHPVAALGNSVNEQFHELPYLFKILDVNDMLSIQVHPTRAEAEKGFDREEAACIPINAAHRNYKDRNHKPEVMVALSDFWLLHGFKVEDELRRVLSDVKEFNFLLPVFEAEGYYGLYKKVMELSQEEVDGILQPLVRRIVNEKPSDKKLPEFWVARVFEQNGSLTNIDRGIFSIFFFNIVEVKPGQAVYQGAGVPHAYLYGQNVELMANSDNVLRGGLTPKHIDVPELLKHTKFEGMVPRILRGEKLASGEMNFDCPVEDFGISAIPLQSGKSYTHKSLSAEIYIVIEGDATVNEMNIKKGEAFIVLANIDFAIKATPDSLLYKAYVPAKAQNRL